MSAEAVPVNAIFEGDFLQLLIVLSTVDTMTEVAAKIAVHSEGLRLPAQDRAKVVYHQGKPQPAEATVADCGIAAFDHLLVAYQEQS
ncbi:toluene-4-monooxygenase system B family protein [Crossiella sp. CA198]|uniref:toluene-4-monooxygenase system B family protein n=1 Tax=Crossiella sp. CA198 TaxID=3455607 RepID=UPI003F8D7F63